MHTKLLAHYLHTQVELGRFPKAANKQCQGQLTQLVHWMVSYFDTYLNFALIVYDRTTLHVSQSFGSHLQNERG